MYGVKITVPAPVEVYDGMHAEMKRQSSHSVDGCLVHIGLATPDGFEVLEVWESKQHYDRAFRGWAAVRPKVRAFLASR